MKPIVGKHDSNNIASVVRNVIIDYEQLNKEYNSEIERRLDTLKEVTRMNKFENSEETFKQKYFSYTLHLVCYSYSKKYRMH